MPEVAILLRANVRPRPHRLAAHAAPRASGGNHRRGFRAQISRLFPRHAAGKRRVAVLLAIEIVRDNNDAVLVIVVAEFHATDPKLLSRLPVELSKTRRGRKHGPGVRQAREHLLQGQTQGLDLLLLHPDRVGLPIYDRQEPETAIAWFSDRFDLDPLCVEISTHSFEPPDYGGKTRSAPDTWNSRIIARCAFSEDRPGPFAPGFAGARCPCPGFSLYSAAKKVSHSSRRPTHGRNIQNRRSQQRATGHTRHRARRKRRSFPGIERWSGRRQGIRHFGYGQVRPGSPGIHPQRESQPRGDRLYRARIPPCRSGGQHRAQHPEANGVRPATARASGDRRLSPRYRQRR